MGGDITKPEASVYSMATTALVVSIIALLLTGVATYFGKRVVDAAEIAISIERGRRHAEMRPHFLVTCEAPSPGTNQRRLLIKLMGPGDLEKIDNLTVTIRDDSYFRLKPTPSSGSVGDHVWGPVRFIPGTGPGTTTRTGAVGADKAGRTTQSVGMPVGEEHSYQLESTRPPNDGAWTLNQWQAEVSSTLRIQIKSQRKDWDDWITVGEVKVSDGGASAEMV